MQVCTMCIQRTAQLYCLCSDPPAKMCEECLAKHQNSDRRSTHELLPIETLPYIHIPGYAEAYKTRTGRQRTAAIQELQGNLELLEQWKNDLKSMYDSFLAIVTQRWEQQAQELSALHSALETAIQAGIQEADDTYIEPDPVLNTAIAKGLRRFRPGTFRLISTCTDLGDYRRKFADLINSTVFEVEMRPIENENLLSATESDTVKVKTGEKTGKKSDEKTGEKVSSDELETKRKETTKITEISPEQSPDHQSRVSTRRTKWKRAIFAVSVMVCMAGILLSDIPDLGCSVTWPKETTEKVKCTRIFESRTHCNGMMDFDSGDLLSYSGEWRSGVKQGTGVLRARDGSMYEGQLVNDTKQGFGLMTKPRNFVYEGSWRNDKRDGVGIEVYETVNSNMELVKVLYIGGFSNDERHGLGVQFDNWVPTYFGFWKSENCDFSRVSSQLQSLSSIGCKSLKEYATKFSVRRPDSFNGTNVEIWTSSSSKAVYLNGLIFTDLLDGAYLESMKIYTGEGAAESSIYVHAKKELMTEYQFSIFFTKELFISANTTYRVQTTFSTDNKYLNEIISPHVEGEVKFDINADGLELRAPRFLRGLIYHIACEDSRSLSRYTKD